MHVLAIYRHYWPDTTPYARLLRAILEHCVTEGHAASVLTAQPSYNDVRQPKQAARETVGGVHIRRVGLLPERKQLKLLRAINFVVFVVRAVFHVLLTRKYDLIVANTHPPVLMGAALRLIKRLTGIPYLLHCQDIHPESALLAGQLKSKWLAQMLLAADTKNCSSAAAVITLSRDMRDQLASRAGYTAENLHVINNFPLDRYATPRSLPALFRQEAEAFRVLFAGNMGLFQDLNRLITAAKLLQDERQIHFIFMGAGAVRKRLIEQAGALLGKTVFFEPFQSVETAFACMQQSNLGVVSLAPEVYRVAYPSKTMMYLAAGCPVLALVERSSKLAEELVANDFGYVSQNGTPEAIAAAVQDAYEDRRRWNLESRQALANRANKHFGRRQALNQWSKILASMESPNASGHSPVVRRAA